jgi:predicted restriction endonuclease
VRDRRDGVCLWGLETQEPCSGGLDPHHIRSKGAGGQDVPENLITLCREHHDAAHRGEITPGQLTAILSRRFGYEYAED